MLQYLCEENPDVIMREWSSLPNERDFWGMNDLMRSENIYGFENILNLNL
jgi:hypothetical protein